MSKNHQISVTFTDTVYDKIQYYAKMKDMKQTEFIRHCVAVCISLYDKQNKKS